MTSKLNIISNHTKYPKKLMSCSMLLFFVINFRLYKMRKPDQIKLYKKPSGFFNKKNLFTKNKKFNNIYNKTFCTLNMLITNLTDV